MIANFHQGIAMVQMCLPDLFITYRTGLALNVPEQRGQTASPLGGSRTALGHSLTLKDRRHGLQECRRPKQYLMLPVIKGRPGVNSGLDELPVLPLTITLTFPKRAKNVAGVQE